MIPGPIAKLMSLTATTLPNQRETRVEDDRLVARREPGGRDAGGGGGVARSRAVGASRIGHVVIRTKRRIARATATSVTRIALSEERPDRAGRRRTASRAAPSPKNSALVPSRIVPGLSRTSMIPSAPEPEAMTRWR